MIRITQIIDSQTTPNATLSLPINSRVKSRLKVTLDDGREAGLFLPRGKILRDGDLVSDDNGLVVQIKAAPELVSTVTSSNPHALAVASYHLGNRHVPLQVEPQWLRYLHDHVLDDMVKGLGLEVKTESAAFEPEAGAYQSSAHGHHH